MKKIIAVFLAVCVVFCTLGVLFASADTYYVEDTVYAYDKAREIDFNDGWEFRSGDIPLTTAETSSVSDWEEVTLPHDYSITQSFTTSSESECGYLPGGIGWYRKCFSLNNVENRCDVMLSFDGVYSDAYVWVNGRYAGENHYGYNAFSFDISWLLNYDGENTILVKTVNDQPNSRWYSGSGIYRDVTLYITERVHVDLDGTAVTTPDISEGTGTVSVASEIVNDSAYETQVTVKNTIYEKNGTEALCESSADAVIPAASVKTITTSSVVPSPKLWSTESPNLYTAVTTVYTGGNEVDSYSTDFGFRWFDFDENTGFSLNGENLKINGVCMHHDQGALGSAAYDDAMRRQVSILKDMGVNAIRTSHNPADADMISICSEMGVLVLDEMFDCWSDSKNGNYNDFGKYFNTAIDPENTVYGGENLTWSEFAVKSTVRRDRNQPSVIAWSLGNELQCGTDGKTGSTYATIAQNLIDTVRSEDSTRLCAFGNNDVGGTVNNEITDVFVNNGCLVGLNYYDDNELSSIVSRHPGCVLFESETASQTNSRGIYCGIKDNADSDGKYHLTSYDTSAVPWGITAHEAIYHCVTHDNLAGQFVWTGFDYIGEPTPWNSNSDRGAYPNSSYFGIVDTAGFEKDTYYLYRSQWNQDENTLNLVTAWDEGNMYTENGKTPVVVYSNAAKIELYRNGTLIGVATRTVNTTDAGHSYYTFTCESKDDSVCEAVTGSGSTAIYATFNVVYEKGTISAVAYDENGNDITESCAGKTSVSTPGEDAKLAVSQNRTEMAADGSSLTYITIDVTDAAGNLDTKADNLINISLSGNGTIVGVDNGDQASTEKFAQPSVLLSSTQAKIKAFSGKALVIVRSTGEAGNINVSVSSDGLEGGSASIKTTASETPFTGTYTVTRAVDVTPTPDRQSFFEKIGAFFTKIFEILRRYFLQFIAAFRG